MFTFMKSYRMISTKINLVTIDVCGSKLILIQTLNDDYELHREK
jgi:hypothetical protein